MFFKSTYSVTILNLSKKSTKKNSEAKLTKQNINIATNKQEKLKTADKLKNEDKLKNKKLKMII
jgi:hypothetical protein